MRASLQSQRICPLRNSLCHDALTISLVKLTLSENIVIYHRGERRVRRVLRQFQSLLGFYGASAFSAVKSKDIAFHWRIRRCQVEVRLFSYGQKERFFIYLLVYCKCH